MGENKRPKLRLIRGGAVETGGSDDANPYGMPRPYHLLPPAGTPRKPLEESPPQRTPKGRGKKGDVRVSTRKEPYVEPDPTPPHGTVRPKRLRVIKGGKE